MKKKHFVVTISDADKRKVDTAAGRLKITLAEIARQSLELWWQKNNYTGEPLDLELERGAWTCNLQPLDEATIKRLKDLLAAHNMSSLSRRLRVGQSTIASAVLGLVIQKKSKDKILREIAKEVAP